MKHGYQPKAPYDGSPVPPNEGSSAKGKTDDLRSYRLGVRAVYKQAVYEGRKDIADWIVKQWPNALCD